VDYISAGDIEKYSYCPLSWWLSRNEEHTENEGVKKHRNISKDATQMKEKYRQMKRFESMAIYYSIGATIIALVGISFFYTSPLLSRLFILFSILWLIFSLYLLWKSERYVVLLDKKNTERIMVIASAAATTFSIFSVTFILPPNYTLGYVLEVLSLLWLIFASYFLYMAIRKEIQYNEIKKKLHLPDGEIIYIDDLQKAPILKSEKYKIWGRPDLLLKIGKDYIPVEIKTGRIPKGPLFSHIMQLTAYMVLVEENYKTPPYGLLKYGPQIYKIEYEEDLKNLMLQKVKEMREALKTGEVHRNHHKVGKCLHCSRRDICPERLA
jgi:CRISPR-associated exonuclease Cas4